MAIRRAILALSETVETGSCFRAALQTSGRFAAMAAAFLVAWIPFAVQMLSPASGADLIVHNGKIVTVDPSFRIVEAMAIRGDRIVDVGDNQSVLALAQPNTRQIDLAGATVLPGLIDSHTHSPGAAVYEFDHPVPTMESIDDVLAYIASRAKALPVGEWIIVQQVFITRLKEQRFPTRAELDRVAPEHPVLFRTGPDAALNSRALKMCGIDRDFAPKDGQAGYAERDPQTGELTGILRNLQRFIKAKSSARTPNAAERREALRKLMADYNSLGITGFVDRGVTDATLAIYQELLARGELTCRVFLTYSVNAQQPLETIEKQVRFVAEHPLSKYNTMLNMRGIKFYLDGGMLTGSAYMLEPWGASDIYGITDPDYCGLIFLSPERLSQVARIILQAGLQPATHSVGDGACRALIDTYEKLAAELPVAQLRPVLCHANFIHPDDVPRMARWGIVADLQPAWLHLDGATLRRHFGEKRMERFQIYRQLFDAGVTIGGGSDHMQKIGRTRSNNFYDPFLAIWTVLTRQPRWTDKPLSPAERLTREEAIRLYTINNAFLTFEEKERGSLEKGKLADFVVLDRDILTCPVDEIPQITVKSTWLGGRQVYPVAQPENN